jgi:hypothetical protein
VTVPSRCLREGGRFLQRRRDPGLGVCFFGRLGAGCWRGGGGSGHGHSVSFSGVEGVKIGDGENLGQRIVIYF